MRAGRRVLGLLVVAGAALWLGAGCDESGDEAGAGDASEEAVSSGGSNDQVAVVEPDPGPHAPRGPGDADERDPYLLPDLRLLEPSSFYLVDQRPSGDRRLKFTTTIWNAGPGPVEVRGHQDTATNEPAVQQVLHAQDGSTVPGDFVGTFQFDHRHGHLHLAGFARYELWSVGEGQLTELVAQNEKVGFCLMDNIVVDEGMAGEPVYPIDCEAEVQGISPGYGDVYVAQLYEQDIVISGLPDGRYALVNVANPERDILEADYENNVQTVYLTISGRRVIPDR